MSLDTLIILVGVLVAVMPFLGFTVAMQMWIIFILGLIVIGLGIALRRRSGVTPKPRRRRGEYVESMPVQPLDASPEASTHQIVDDTTNG